MIQDIEKPLLSDYEVKHDEKLETPESIHQAQRTGPRPDSALSSGRTNKPDWTRKFQKLGSLAMKISIPISRKTSDFGCEPFVPLPIDKECQKAARIIKSFSYNPYEGAPEAQPSQDKNTPQDGAFKSDATSTPHLATIPPCVISNATGLIIFTTGRLGLGHLSGSTGSGLLIVRGDNGAWGTPIPIQAYSIGGGPLAFGAEITNRVYVLNNRSALELFKNARFELGPEVVLAAGPYGGGGGITFSGMSSGSTSDQTGSPEQGKSIKCSCGRHGGAFQDLRQSLAQPVYCYMRSRGLYAGLQAEGTIFVQHPDSSIPESASAVLIDALKKAEADPLPRGHEDGGSSTVLL